MTESAAQPTDACVQPEAPSAEQPLASDNSAHTIAHLIESQTRLGERIEDLGRVIARQAATIERLTDDAKARAERDRAGADLPLIVELFALHGDTATCATTAESIRERDAFAAITTRIERLIIGRGGSLVTPHADDAFDALTMEAADTTKTDDPELDRTVDSVLRTGLIVAGRSVRPAGVVVRRYQAPASGAADRVR
ncbi:nucleotide exchange factor GrpE [Nocardia sp. CA-129566]|uniref:nucleotide exchange factor GrpE n=1 Tax=Nocardia sp. CA-129566 TaxID=3239976 RepID=UPI003D97E508